MAKRKQHNVRLLTKAEVCARLGITAPTLWRWCRAEHFPLGIRIGTATDTFQRVAWIAQEVDDWIINRPRQQLKEKAGGRRRLAKIIGG